MSREWAALVSKRGEFWGLPGERDLLLGRVHKWTGEEPPEVRRAKEKAGGTAVSGKGMKVPPAPGRERVRRMK